MEIPLPTTDNFWLTLLVFILFGAPAVFSKTAANLPWVFGALGKWWQNRSANNSSTQRIVTQANLSKIIDARVEEKVGHLREEVEQLRKEVDDQGGYLVYDASWHRRQSIFAAQQGYEFSPPPHLSFEQWKAKESTNGDLGALMRES